MSCLAQGMSDEAIHDAILQRPDKTAQPIEDSRVEAGRDDVSAVRDAVQDRAGDEVR